MITRKELDDSLREVLASMVDEVDYVMTREIADEINEYREKHGWSTIDRMKYRIRVDTGVFYVNGGVVFDDISTATATGMETATETAMAMITGEIIRADANGLDFMTEAVT